MMPHMSPEQVSAALQDLPEWTLAENEIRRQLVLPDFASAMIFVNRVAELAEEEEHHPEICIAYNKVTLTLTTHDADGLTAADFRLAHRISELGTERPEEDGFF